MCHVGQVHPARHDLGLEKGLSWKGKEVKSRMATGRIQSEQSRDEDLPEEERTSDVRRGEHGGEKARKSKTRHVSVARSIVPTWVDGWRRSQEGTRHPREAVSQMGMAQLRVGMVCGGGPGPEEVGSKPRPPGSSSEWFEGCRPGSKRSLNSPPPLTGSNQKGERRSRSLTILHPFHS